MNLKGYQINVIEALAKHEEAIGELYKAYSEKFMSYKQFWIALFADEKDHSYWIRQLLGKAKDGFVFFQEDRFKIEAINTSSEYVREQIEALKTEKISEINALAIAYDLENALLERKFFEIFESDFIEIKNIFLDLAEATTRHREIIKKALEEKRQLV